jgi:hypothetical protein
LITDVVLALGDYRDDDGGNRRTRKYHTMRSHPRLRLRRVKALLRKQGKDFGSATTSLSQHFRQCPMRTRWS